MTKATDCLHHAESYATYNTWFPPHMFYDHKVLDIMEYILCIGKKQKDLLSKFHPKIKKKILVTGDINYYLLNKKYSFFLDEQKKIIKKKFKKKFILFPSNFSFVSWKIANNDTLNYDPKMDKYSKYNKQKFLDWKKYEIQRNKHEKLCVKSYINVIKIISKYFRDIDIVVRPHPADHPFFWRNKFKQNNIFIEYSYDIKSWISLCEFSLSFACSSVIENYFSKKKSLCYFPYYKKEFDKKFYYNLSLNSKSLKKLINDIKTTLKNKKRPKRVLNKEYIYHNENELIIKKYNFLNKIKTERMLNSKIIELLIYASEYLRYFLLKMNRNEFAKDKKKWTNNHNNEYYNIVKKYNIMFKKNLNYKKIGPYITKIY